MAKWYKYLEAKYAKLMIDTGSLRISALSSYQDIERHGSAVGDRFENTKIIYSADQQLKTSPDQLNPLERRFFKVGPNVRNMRFQNNVINLRVRGEPLYAYCMSSAVDKDIMDRMSMENIRVGKKPYDACVEIIDAWGFVNVLTNKLKECGFKYQGHGNCFYRGRLVHWSAPNDIPTWQLKDEEYGYQRECRVMFRAPSGNSDQSFTIKSSPAIRDYCRLLRM